MINTFTATNELMTCDIIAATQPTTVQFMLTDSSLISATLTGNTGTTWTYSISGDYSDGIFTVIVDSGLGTEEEATISNQLVSTQCLLDKVLSDEYDCKLMQDIESVNLLINSAEGELAREIYVGILNKCTQCEDFEQAELTGISIWIVNNDFEVQ